MKMSMNDDEEHKNYCQINPRLIRSFFLENLQIPNLIIKCIAQTTSSFLLLALINPLFHSSLTSHNFFYSVL